jgi:hypothetical protein
MNRSRVADLTEPDAAFATVAPARIRWVPATPAAHHAFLQRFQCLLERPVPQRLLSQHSAAAPRSPWTAGIPVQH